MENSTIEQFETIKHLYNEQREELSYRRHREFQIFSWSTTILIAITGAFLLSDPKKGFLTSSGLFGSITASVVVVALTAFSINWQLNQRKCSAAHQRVIVKLDELLGCFNTNVFAYHFQIYPDEWKNWGHKNINLWEQLIKNPTKINATALLGLAAFASIWLPYFVWLNTIIYKHILDYFLAEIRNIHCINNINFYSLSARSRSSRIYENTKSEY
jgi:hypothetical protein